MTHLVIVLPYDLDWPCRFDEERSVLAAVSAGIEAVSRHVGSTAVPGLGAKPVIDVTVGLPALVEVEARMPALEAAGYEYVQNTKGNSRAKALPNVAARTACRRPEFIEGAPQATEPEWGAEPHVGPLCSSPREFFTQLRRAA
jgi:GrpB-like predicted nucleotidyltransferase (UPF0157 family)